MNNELFGALLAAERTGRGLSYHRLATRSGLSPTHLRSLELGQRNPPPPDMVMVISEALGVNPTQMLRASLTQRGSMELSVPRERVIMCADLAQVWARMDAASLAAIERIISGVCRG